MTELFDFIFGLFTLNSFFTDYSKIASIAVEIKEPFRTSVLEIFRKHMQLDPATNAVQYDSLLVKTIGKKHVKLVALDADKNVFSYICKKPTGFSQTGYGIIKSK